MWVQTHLEVKLAVQRLAISVDQFEGVGAVAVHVAEAIGQTSIAEQERHLHRAFGTEEKKTAFCTVVG